MSILTCKHHWVVDRNDLGICRFCGEIKQFISFHYDYDFSIDTNDNFEEEGVWDNVVKLYENG